MLTHFSLTLSAIPAPHLSPDCADKELKGKDEFFKLPETTKVATAVTTVVLSDCILENRPTFYQKSQSDSLRIPNIGAQSRCKFRCMRSP